MIAVAPSKAARMSGWPAVRANKVATPMTINKGPTSRPASAAQAPPPP